MGLLGTLWRKNKPNQTKPNPKHMGYTFSRDASKYYYSANTFSIFTVDDYLMDFLLRDPIHHYSNDQKVVIPLGVIPLDYVRSLQIRVKYEHCANIVAGRDVVLADIHARLHEFANHLAPERAVHLNIEIVLMSRFPSATEKIDNLSCRLLNLYEAIRTPFYKLKHDIGVREIRITHHDEIYFIFPRNVTKVFQLSRMEWDYVS